MRVVIAEDQVLLREGLGRLFEGAGHDVLAAVDNADRLRAAVSEHTPDLAVVDVRMPPSFSDEGIRAAGWIRDAHPEVGVLVLTMGEDDGTVLSALRAGARGYLRKGAEQDEIVRTPVGLQQLVRDARHGTGDVGSFEEHPALRGRVCLVMGSAHCDPLPRLTGRILKGRLHRLPTSS